LALLAAVPAESPLMLSDPSRYTAGRNKLNRLVTVVWADHLLPRVRWEGVTDETGVTYLEPR